VLSRRAAEADQAQLLSSLPTPAHPAHYEVFWSRWEEGIIIIPSPIASTTQRVTTIIKMVLNQLRDYRQELLQVKEVNSPAFTGTTGNPDAGRLKAMMRSIKSS